MRERKPMPFWQQILIELILLTLCAAKIAQLAVSPDSRRLSDFLLLAAWLIIAYGWTRRIAGTIRQRRAGRKEAEREDAP